MAILKTKELKKMSKEEREGKIKELKMELVKSRINASKNKGARTRDIKKIIARIMTLNNQKQNLGVE
ncbi:MAG: 50S ribosomal protein L29 [Candidatus Pacearchaeota archaeon]